MDELDPNREVVDEFSSPDTDGTMYGYKRRLHSDPEYPDTIKTHELGHFNDNVLPNLSLSPDDEVDWQNHGYFNRMNWAPHIRAEENEYQRGLADAEQWQQDRRFLGDEYADQNALERELREGSAGLFEYLAYDDSDRKARGRKAVVLASTRVRNRFGAFLMAAKGGDDWQARRSLIENDVEGTIREACAEVSYGEPDRVISIVSESLPGYDAWKMQWPHEGSFSADWPDDVEGEAPHSGKPCRQCAGTGWNAGEGNNCSWCGGTGQALPDEGYPHDEHEGLEWPHGDTLRDEHLGAGGFCDECKNWKSGPRAGCTCGKPETDTEKTSKWKIGQKWDKHGNRLTDWKNEGPGMHKEAWDDYDDPYDPDFADPGGESALRAERPGNRRHLPCPTCGEPNMLTPADAARGYQCDNCARRDEGHEFLGSTSATAPAGADSYSERKKVKQPSGPSPKMDKQRWKPNALNDEGNLKPIDADGKGSHPTEKQDIQQPADHTKDFLEQTDGVAKHDQDVTKHKEHTRNIKQNPTKTFGDKGQADPVTSTTKLADESTAQIITTDPGAGIHNAHSGVAKKIQVKYKIPGNILIDGEPFNPRPAAVGGHLNDPNGKGRQISIDHEKAPALRDKYNIDIVPYLARIFSSPAGDMDPAMDELQDAILAAHRAKKEKAQQEEQVEQAPQEAAPQEAVPEDPSHVGATMDPDKNPVLEELEQMESDAAA